jgi:hypothetical protein
MIGTAEMNAILAEKAKANANEDFKTIVVRLPRALYAKTQKQQGRMLDEAAETGMTSKISITTVVTAALEAFCE